MGHVGVSTVGSAGLPASVLPHTHTQPVHKVSALLETGQGEADETISVFPFVVRAIRAGQE